MTRFLVQHNTVVDQSTGLEWFRDASLFVADGPQEALPFGNILLTFNAF